MNKIVTLEILGKESFNLFRKIPVVMRLSVVFLFLSLGIAVANNSYAQNTTLSLDMSNSTIANVLEAVENQTDFSFIYDANVVNINKKVSVSVNEKNIFDVLNKMFGNSDIAYTVVNKKIILNKKEAIDLMQQQGKRVTGVVVDKNNEPVIGANILVKGTTNGTITDVDGNYTLDNVPADAILVYSYIGFDSQELKYDGQATINVTLSEDTQKLDEVVVTAMGIKKKAASLTYSSQQVGGDELTRAKDPNMITALAGKTAGVQINKNSSGLGGSAKVSIRGIRSANADANNQPLYVIDGVPMLNSISEQASSAMGGTNNAGNRDSGDGISNLNPDDIESMSILKGASAAALYGSQAANGVILITTKKGKAGLQRVTFSSNFTVDHAISLPEFQNEYGRKDNLSWGEKGNLKDYDNAGDFFQNGVTAINSLSLTRGNDKLQTYFSYANTSASGVVEKNKLQKHNLNFRETAQFFDDRLNIDANVNLMTQSIKNRPTSGGYYMNPLVGLYGFPRGEDITPYKDGYETNDFGRNMPIQNWYTDITSFEQNPYWLVNRVTSRDKRYRALASLTAALTVTDWLKIQARGNVDYTNDKFQQKMYATTSVDLAGTNGRYIDLNHTEMLLYGDVMAMVNKKWNDWSLNAALGSSINSTRVDELRLDSKTASLYYPNVFTVANINMNTSAACDEIINQRRTLQSIFATAQVGWKESLYLDVTARNDWSSTLAFTKHKNKGFFYPSVGLSWIMNNTLDMPEWINFGKLRGSWSKVGNDIPLYVSNPVDMIGAGGKIIVNEAAAFDNLKPELSTSWEVGTEWKFFNYRLDLDFTYYRTNTKNQLLKMPSFAGSPYKYYYVNAGNIQNEGVELTLGVTPVMTNDFRWKTSFNFSTNKNKVVKLHPELKSFAYGDEGFSMMYMMRIKEGGSLGDLYGNAFERDEAGKIVYDENNLPNVITGNNVKIGNSNPDALLGWSNTFTYKDFSLYFLIDCRFGGDVLSVTQADLDSKGVSQATADARRAGFVDLEGTHIGKENIEAFYSRVGGRNGCSEYYMYDATNVRLRELSLGYTFPRKLMEKSKVFQEAQLSFVARNLFFFYKDAPFDPDASLSSGNGCQGVDVFGMPTTRSLGFNLKVSF